jgi:N-formylglutamate amidohydrolase
MQPSDPPRDDSRHGQGSAVGSGKGQGGGGAIPGLPGQAAFTLALDSKAPLPVLISVPHAGRSYPPDLIARMQHPLAASLRLEDRLVDLVAREVARDTGAGLIVAHAPRAMIDLNRADDDIDWDMVAGATQRTPRGMSAGRRARSGLGLVPRRLAGLGDVWTRRLSVTELDSRIDTVHRPYHAAIAGALEQLRDRWGGALLLDVHSMPPLGPKTKPDPAADFVLGDRFGASCAPALATAALAVLEASGRPAVRNRPYAGGYVLERHGAPLRGIHALQVEICRSTYLDSQMRDAGPGVAAVARLLAGMVRALADALAEGRRLPQAAE